MRRSLLLSILILATFAADAGACSCAARSPAEKLADADAAFIGKVTAVRSEEAQGSTPTFVRRVRVYTVAVEKVHKGDVGETAEVRGENPDGGGFTSCGEFFEVGDELGGYFDGQPQEWFVHTCNRATREELEIAAKGFPPPRASGRAAFLLAGPFGRSAFAALDQSGRVIAYARGGAVPSRPAALAPCPGGRVLLESDDRITVRRFSDLETIARFRGPGAGALRCLDREGRRAVTVRSAGLTMVGRGGARLIARGRFPEAAFGRARAAVGGTSLAVVDYGSGRKRVLRRGGGGSTSVALSADGRRVAEIAAGRVAVYDVRTRRSRTKAARGADRVLFTRTGTLLVLGPEQARAYDERLRPVKAPVTAGIDSVLSGSDLFYVSAGRLRAAPLSGDPVRSLAEVPFSHAPLVPVPARPLVRGSYRPSASQARSSSPCSSRAGGGRRT